MANNPFIPDASTPDTKSGAKAKVSHDRAEREQSRVQEDQWPTNSKGHPLTKLSMSASELIPTQQYANVSVGPATITTFVDLEEESYDSFFSETQRRNMSMALNELAEVVEADVIAYQRNIVLDGMKKD